MTYNLAFQFRQSKLWRKLQPTDTFAVQLTDGSARSCHVEGRNGEEAALVAGEDRLVFVEKAELSSSELSAIKRSARTYKLKLKNDDLYPRFEGGTPKAWIEILEAVLWLSDALSKSNKARIGIGGGVPLFVRTPDGFSISVIPSEELENLLTPAVNGVQILDEAGDLTWPSPAAVPDRIIRKLRSFRRNHVLQCDIIHLERTLLSDDGKLFQPVICFPVDKDTRKPLSVWYFTEDPYDPDKMLLKLLDVMIDSGYYPKKIEIRTDEVDALLRGFCQKANIQLRRIKTLPELDLEFGKFLDELDKKLAEP